MTEPVKSPNPDVSAEDARRAVGELTRLLEQLREFLTAELGEPYVVGSPAEAEAQSFKKPSLIETACFQGRFQVVSAADHAWSFTRGVTEPCLVIAPVSAARICLEASALAVWLLDPRIDARERVARSYALRYRALTQQLKTARDLEDSEAEEKLNARIAALDDEAFELGYDRRRGKNDRIAGLGRPMPTATALVQDELSKGHLYRIFSAAVHGDQTALRDISLHFSPSDERSDGEFVAVRAGLSPLFVVVASVEVATCLATAVWRGCEYLGAPLPRVEAILDQGFDAMRIKDNRRSWKAN